MSSLHPLRVACRTLARRPGSTILAVAILSLGIGAATTLFSVVEGVVLSPLPYPASDRLVRLHMVGRSGDRAPWSGANYVDLKRAATSYSGVAGYRFAVYSMPTERFPVVVGAASVTTGFLRVLGVEPLLGPGFPALESGAADRPVVLGYALWQSRFGADPGIVGRPVDLNGETHTVVGVMPKGFDYPARAELWVASPYAVPEDDSADTGDPSTSRDSRYFRVVARLADGVTLAEARAEGATIMRRISTEHPESDRDVGFDAATLRDAVVGDVRPVLLAVFGAVGLLLAIACVNVANLQLAQATSRVREMAVRRALGAGRARVVGQLLAESLLIGLGGAAGGMALAAWGTPALIRAAAADLPRAAEVGTNLPVLAFAVGAALVASFLFGLAPAVWLDGTADASALRGRSGGSLGPGHTRLRSSLVAVEIALSLALLVGAGLLLRTFAALDDTDPGFRPEGVLSASIWLTGGRTPSDDDVRAFHGRLLERARALPGVTSAGLVLSLPVHTGISARTTYSFEGRPVERGTEPGGGLQAASPGYFEAMGIPILRGRGFTDADVSDSLPVAVVSASLAARYYPGEDPVGKRIGTGNPADDDFRWRTIVGVAGDTLYDGLAGEPRVELYDALAQRPWSFTSLVLHTDGDPAILADPIREMVSDLLPLQPVYRVATMPALLHGALARQRLNAALVSVFATLALVLAAMGLYSVMSFAVSQRRRELGIRLALGATPVAIARRVVGDGTRILGVGLVVGLSTALVLTRLLRGLLHGVAPSDPVAVGGSIAVLAAAALIAMWLPARRASRLDPAASLRAE